MNSSQFKILLLIQLVTLFLVGILFFKESKMEIGKPLNSPHAKAIKKNNKISVDYGSNFVYGSSEAKNELIVFTRYNCEYCRNFYNEVFDSLKKNYINTGKLKVVFIDNVNPKDKLGMMMAQIAEIGKQLNQYEAIQDKLYKNLQSEDSLSIIKLALSSGISEDALNKKLFSHYTKESIMNDNKEGDRLQITGTPTFFLNGMIISGYNGYEDFEKILHNSIN